MVLLSSSIRPSPRSLLPIMFSVLIINGTTKPIPHTPHAHEHEYRTTSC